MGVEYQDQEGQAAYAYFLHRFLHDSLAENRVQILPVRYEDILLLEHLDNHHRDAFDRIIVAQAIANGLKLLTEDEEMKLYPVSTIW